MALRALTGITPGRVRPASLGLGVNLDHAAFGGDFGLDETTGEEIGAFPVVAGIGSEARGHGVGFTGAGVGDVEFGAFVHGDGAGTGEHGAGLGGETVDHEQGVLAEGDVGGAARGGIADVEAAAAEIEGTTEGEQGFAGSGFHAAGVGHAYDEGRAACHAERGLRALLGVSSGEFGDAAGHGEGAFVVDVVVGGGGGVSGEGVHAVEGETAALAVEDRAAFGGGVVVFKGAVGDGQGGAVVEDGAAAAFGGADGVADEVGIGDGHAAFFGAGHGNDRAAEGGDSGGSFERVAGKEGAVDVEGTAVREGGGNDADGLPFVLGDEGVVADDGALEGNAAVSAFHAFDGRGAAGAHAAVDGGFFIVDEEEGGLGRVLAPDEAGIDEGDAGSVVDGEGVVQGNLGIVGEVDVAVIADFAPEGSLDVEIFRAFGAHAVDHEIVVLALEADEAVHAAVAFEADGGVVGVVNEDGDAVFVGHDAAGVGEELVVVGFFVLVAGDGDADAAVAGVDVAEVGDFAGGDVFLAVEDAHAAGVFHGDNVFVHKGFAGGTGIVGHGAALAHGDEALVDGLAVGIDAHALGGGGGCAVHKDAAVVGEGEAGAGFAAHAFGVGRRFGGFHPDVAVIFGVGIVCVA